MVYDTTTYESLHVFKYFNPTFLTYYVFGFLAGLDSSAQKLSYDIGFVTTTAPLTRLTILH